MICSVARRLACRVSANRAICRMVGIVITSLLCCSSCDMGIRTPFEKYNTAWSWDPCNPQEAYNLDLDGWHGLSEGGAVAVLQWQGRGQLGAEALTIILCLKNVGQGSNVPYRLSKGMLVATNLREISFTEILDSQSFSCEVLAGKRLRHTYNAQAAGEPAAARLSKSRLLRFCVVSSRNDRETATILSELYSRLREQGTAGEVLTCIAPFLGEWKEGRAGVSPRIKR